MYVCRDIFLLKKVLECKECPKNSVRVVVIVISMPGKKFPERSSSLRPCEKELLELN
jgi:hypothetical protein